MASEVERLRAENAALRAAVGEAGMGRQIGPKAMLWGAVIATVPDLDVFVPLGSDVDDFSARPR